MPELPIISGDQCITALELIGYRFYLMSAKDMLIREILL